MLDEEMWSAVRAGELDVLLSLMKRGADVNARNNIIDYDTPLMWVAMRGPWYIADALIRNGARVNAKGHGGITALINAAYNGRVDIVRSLIEAGADVNARTTEGVTALRLAKGCLDNAAGAQMIAMLEKAGARE